MDNGEADFAVIPVENSNAGRVSDVHFLLPKTDLTIVGEHFCAWSTNCWRCRGQNWRRLRRRHRIRRLWRSVRSFEKHAIKALSRIDTAKSCERIVEMQDKTRAAIASKLAAEIYGLDILASNIENEANNTTRFW